jgi:hypothetical protein
MDHDKHVDESWKDSVANEKSGSCGEGCGCGSSDAACGDGECGDGACGDSCGCGGGAPEVSFLNYVMSMGYQAMIFLGEVPHPSTGKSEQNLQQAKFLIDTLQMLKEKTKGNLNEQEESILTASLYELQMRFVQLSGQGEKA